MTTTISKWGNSQGLRLPKEVMKELHLLAGDKMRILVQDNRIILEPIKPKKKYNINDLVKDIPTNYKPYEEFQIQMGKEEW